MSNERLSVALENGRFAKVTMWQNEPRLDLRQWEIGQTNNKPTKKGISLKLLQVKTLKNGMESIQESLKKNEDLKWHLGMNVYASVQKDNPCVDIRIGNDLNSTSPYQQKKDCVFDLRNLTFF